MPTGSTILNIMACQSSADKQLDDMTECSICTEVFTDPRVLPCIHTFCLNCLQNYGKDSRPGDRMPCPLCRKEFAIPDDGLSGTQKNFFMEKLLHVRKLSAGQKAQQIPCDVCTSDEASAGETVKPASMYCVQCQQNYCEQCSMYHRKMKSSSGHAQVNLGKVSKSSELVCKLPPAMCDQHKSEEIKVFCQECRAAICVMCFIKAHKTHDCSDVEEVSDNLRSLVVSDAEKVTTFFDKTREHLPRLEKEKNDVIKHLAGIEDEINTAADKLIAAIQRDRAKLLSEVESIKLKRIKQVEMVKQDVERHMTALESFRRYSATLLSNGTACDVTRSANSLHDRADELMKFDVIGHVDSSLPPANVTFTSSTLLDKKDRNLVGTVTEQDSVSGSPTVVHVMPRGQHVLGVTSLGDDVFVLRHKCQQKIEVYDAETFTFQRHITVPELGNCPRGLVACAYNNCLYASDWSSDSVHRIDLSGSDAVMKWSVASRPAGLSVNNQHSLIVVSWRECRLEIFTTHGTLLQNIQLQEEPWHAVQLPSGQFLVSHCGSLRRVCLVGVDGVVFRSYDGHCGSELTQMISPRSMAVDREGRVLVADQWNDRVLVIDESLWGAHDLSINVDGGLNDPFSLWYDQSRMRLYIGEYARGRLIVVGNLKDFRAD